ADRRGGAGPGVGAHDDDRSRRLRHDVPDGAEAVELRHLEVHRDDSGIELVDLADGVEPVAGGGDHPERPPAAGAAQHVGPDAAPASLATSRRRSAPRAPSRSMSRGTAVSGNFAGFWASCAKLLDGSRTWAIAPARAAGS